MAGPVLGAPGLAPANFFGGAPAGRGRNSRGRSSLLPAPPSNGLGRRAGGPSVRGVKRCGRSPEAGRDGGRDVVRDGPPGRNSPRGRNGLSPDGAGPRPSAGRSVRGRNGLLPANGRSPPEGLPAAGRNGLPPGAERLNPPLRGRSSRGLSVTGSMRKPGVFFGTKSSSSAGGAGRAKFALGPAGLNGLSLSNRFGGPSCRNAGRLSGLASRRNAGFSPARNPGL